VVSVSQETDREIDVRLLDVVRRAALTVYEGAYVFQEFGIEEFPVAASPRALAFIRDDDVWSQLVASDGTGQEEFSLFRFHFPPNVDNSGFVGWLASRLKRQFGTGVFVTCGQNSKRGGIYDYWGVPVALGPAVVAEVRALCGMSERGG
jgi:hypothetical protein